MSAAVDAWQEPSSRMWTHLRAGNVPAAGVELMTVGEQHGVAVVGTCLYALGVLISEGLHHDLGLPGHSSGPSPLVVGFEPINPRTGQRCQNDELPPEAAPAGWAHQLFCASANADTHIAIELIHARFAMAAQEPDYGPASRFFIEGVEAYLHLLAHNAHLVPAEWDTDWFRDEKETKDTP